MSSLADIPVAILCGGLGTRLGSITQELPKALMEVNGRPFLEHQLGILAKAGFKRVVLCIGHLGDQIVNRMTNSRFGLTMTCVHDKFEAAMGTAGALRGARRHLGDVCFVLYGDSYMPCDYAEIYRKFTLNPCEVVRCVTSTKTHPKLHDYGVYVMTARALACLPPEGDLSHVLNWWRPGIVRDLLLEDPYYEIGTPEALRATREWFARGAIRDGVSVGVSEVPDRS